MNISPAPGQRNTREEMIRLALLYPDGLRVGSFVTADAQFAPDAYRFENGQLMAGPGSLMRGEGELSVWEMFKIYDGRINAVEAFMEEVPANTPFIWEY